MVGYFTAATSDDDDLVMYTNGAYITITNFSVTETNSIGEGMSQSDLLKGTGAFSSSSGWTTNGWTITGGYAQGGSSNDSIYRYPCIDVVSVGKKARSKIWKFKARKEVKLENKRIFDEKFFLYS